MIRFSVDPLKCLRISTFSGTVDDQELIDTFQNLFATPGYDTRLHDLADLRDVEVLKVSPAGVQRLARLRAPGDPLKIPTKLAIVAPTPYLFGMARMYELLRTDALGKIHVFRELAQAEAWLGISLATEHRQRDESSN